MIGTVSSDDLDKIEISIFPNPVDDVLNIDLYGSLQKEHTVKVVDVHGKVQKSFIILSDTGTAEIDASDLSAGVYLMLIDNATSIITKKIIVK